MKKALPKKEREFIPLAERMRPKSLDKFYGQSHLIGEGKILSQLIKKDHLISLIFWGPPGSGKTTLGTILADRFNLPCMFYSAVLSSIKEIKEVMEKAEEHNRLYKHPTLIFIDEIHRFNKAQQAAFLPYVERGEIILFGSTTENPSFEVIAPLLSRTKVLKLETLGPQELEKILNDALKDKKGLGERKIEISKAAMNMIVKFADGDARRALNTMEIAAHFSKNNRIDSDDVQEALQKRVMLYDRNGEEHFNLISALHKSLRNSDVNASLYWLARMIVSGEDCMYIARRLVRFASEDIGLADNQALTVALNAKDAYHFLGSPEGELALAQAAVYLASAPKSNRVYKALDRAVEDVKSHLFKPVPLHLRNPVTSLMKEKGYGKDYKYAHDYSEATTNMETMPEGLRNRNYYEPGSMGFEKEIKKRIEWWQSIKEKIRDKK
jgi:putative ATPase